MFLKERQDAIADLIALEGRVTVGELAQLFGVSDDCIRKDLKTLVEQGRARKVYGGAIRPESLADRMIMNRVDIHEPQKRALAQKAYELVEENSTIYLDCSSTNHYLAELLATGPKPLHVASNMIDVLQVLAGRDHLQVTGVGGTVSGELNGFTGPQTLAMLEPLRFDAAFMGALGVDPKTGDVTTFDADDGMVKRAVLARCQVAYLLIDSSKVGAWGTFSYATLDSFAGIVMEPEAKETARGQVLAELQAPLLW